MTRKERDLIDAILADIFQIHGQMRKRNKGTDGLEMLASRIRHRLLAQAVKLNRRRAA